MKIKFISKQDIPNLYLENIFLSASNPRYTPINDIDIDLQGFLLKNDYKNEEKTFLKLLSLEGDYSDLLSLLKSIHDNGFDNNSEPIYLIKNNNDYVVAEGNRRIMCLKLLSGILKLPEIDNIKFDTNKYQNFTSEYLDNELNDDDNENNTKLKAIKNYEECEKLISKLKEKNETISVNIEINKSANELWRQIYDRHLTGDREGSRKWSRSKYFVDLLCMFKNGINRENKVLINKMFSNFRRNINYILEDFREAQYVYSCFYFYYNQNKEYGPNFNELDDDILSSMIYSSRISALERKHSYNKIVILICDEILNITQNEFKDKYLEIKFDSNNKIEFISKSVKTNIFLSFIFKQWEDKKITTRNFKEDIKSSLIDQIILILKNLTNIRTLKTIDELNEINEFELSIDNLENLIKANEDYYQQNNQDVIQRFKFAKKIKESNEKFLKEISNERNWILEKNLEPISVFNKLIMQLKHNFKTKNKEVYLNAIAVTLRSITDQLIIWFSFYTW